MKYRDVLKLEPHIYALVYWSFQRIIFLSQTSQQNQGQTCQKDIEQEEIMRIREDFLVLWQEGS